MMEYIVNGHKLTYHAEGESKRGPEEVLLTKGIDLTQNTSWADKGYGIENLFAGRQLDSFREGIKDLLINCWRESGLPVDENFRPEHYHQLAVDQLTHLRAVEKTKLLSIDRFPIPIEILEDRISTICRTKLITCNPFDGQRIFHFRVIRPTSVDNNPLHRDVWLEDYDNCINLYIPVAGSNEKSSLILLEGSHHWPESRIEKTISGALINGTRFNVPAVTKIYGDYTSVRPSPAENEVLIFSPYLVHGGSINLNTIETRISIEMRLWKK